MDGFVDEFKLYNRALTNDEIQADAAFALGGVEPSFVELGCMVCDQRLRLTAHGSWVTDRGLGGIRIRGLGMRDQETAFVELGCMVCDQGSVRRDT